LDDDMVVNMIFATILAVIYDFSGDLATKKDFDGKYVNYGYIEICGNTLFFKEIK
jgi:hypothetical protein